jgi:hypothetical protein
MNCYYKSRIGYFEGGEIVEMWCLRVIGGFILSPSSRGAFMRRGDPVYVFVIFLDSDASLAMTEGGRNAYAMYVIKEFYDILS